MKTRMNDIKYHCLMFTAHVEIIEKKKEKEIVYKFTNFLLMTLITDAISLTHFIVLVNKNYYEFHT